MSVIQQVRRLLRIAGAQMRTMAALIFEYRATVLLWMLAGITPLIMMFVWRNIAAEGAVGGRGPDEITFYFLLTFLVTQCCQVWIIWNVSFHVSMGTYSIHLLRPYDPWLTELLENITANGMRLPINLAIVIVGLTVSGTWHLIDPMRLPGFILAVLLAWQIMFNIDYALGLGVLWTERIKSAEAWVYTMLYCLGGALFPLNLVDPQWRAIIEWTPFPWMVGFPMAMLDGSADPWRGFAMQAFWIAVPVCAHRLMWKRGLKFFGAVGG
jgi:ABC-2 type transport system permease protein